MGNNKKPFTLVKIFFGHDTNLTLYFKDKEHAEQLLDLSKTNDKFIVSVGDVKHLINSEFVQHLYLKEDFMFKEKYEFTKFATL